MDFGIGLLKTEKYIVNTPVFEGPLDLLLHLIEKAELDITSLSIAQVTDQYLEHIRFIQERTPDQVSHFLVIAARLLQIKSEALLPRPPRIESGSEDAGENLARQLRIYKLFKEAGIYLAERENAGLKTYLRLSAPPQIEPNLNMEGITLSDLLSYARTIFIQEDDRINLGNVVSPPRVTIKEKIVVIAHRLQMHGDVYFRDLFQRTPSVLEIVVTFLAMLELIKRRVIISNKIHYSVK